MDIKSCVWVDNCEYHVTGAIRPRQANLTITCDTEMSICCYVWNNYIITNWDIVCQLRVTGSWFTFFQGWSCELEKKMIS